MADSHKKIDVKEKIKETAKSEGKYSPESLRANMATGGGTPIPKGHKRTNEHRVLQPRDPDTGHFTYNSDADLSLKYKSHGKGDAEPIAYKSFSIHEDVKKGDVVNIGGATFIALQDISKEKLADFFRHFDAKEGEYYSYADHLPSKETLEGGFDKVNETVLHATKLSDLVVKKKGRVSKEEAKAIGEGKGVVGHKDIEALGQKTKDEIAAKMVNAKKGFKPNQAVDQNVAPMDPKKAAKNEQLNKEYDEAQRAKQEVRNFYKKEDAQQKPAEKAMGAPQEKPVPQNGREWKYEENLGAGMKGHSIEADEEEEIEIED